MVYQDIKIIDELFAVFTKESYIKWPRDSGTTSRSVISGF